MITDALIYRSCLRLSAFVQTMIHDLPVAFPYIYSPVIIHYCYSLIIINKTAKVQYTLSPSSY